MASQTRHFEFEAAILDLEPAVDNDDIAVDSWQWRHRKIYEFVLGNILYQNKHKKAKDYLFLTNEG